MDQLPDWIQVAGIPRQLEAEQAKGLINLGLVAGDGLSTYEVCLRADKIWAILSGNAQQDEKVRPMAPSDSVSETGKEPEWEKKVREALTFKSWEQATKVEVEQNPDKAAKVTQQEIVPRPNKTANRTTEIENTPLAYKARAWDEESDLASPDIVSAYSETQSQPTKQQHDGRADTMAKIRPSEPMLSASRHNTAANPANDKPPQRDKSIRPCLADQGVDTRTPRIIPHGKEKFSGAKPDSIYCRHWCHHGTCKWGWECRYQHRMPTNQEGLREVGLKDFPTWYLLIMASGGFPGPEGFNSVGLQSGMNMGMTAMESLNHSTAIDNTNGFVSYLGRPSNRADTPLPCHASSMELRLMQGRMSALLAGSTTMSNRQKLRQIKEMRETFLRTNALEHNDPISPLELTFRPGHHYGRENLHTNASMADNAAGLSAASRRQALREAESEAVAPMEIPPQEVNRKVKASGSYDELKGTMVSVGTDEEGQICGGRNTAVREGQLVEVE